VLVAMLTVFLSSSVLVAMLTVFLSSSVLVAMLTVFLSSSVLVAMLTVFLSSSVLVVMLTVFLSSSVLVVMLTVFLSSSVLVVMFIFYLPCFVSTGENAKKNRSAMKDIIHRYFAGDKSLLDEIEANAKSDHPMAQMARDSLPVNDKEELEDRKRKRVREDAEVQKLRINNLSAFSSLMDKLNPSWTQDDRLVMQTQDLLKNTMFNSSMGNARIENGESAEDEHAPISVSQVAQDAGKRLTQSQSIKIGRLAAEKYREQYGKEPSKHPQYVDGATRMVNSYTEKDRSLVEEAINEFFDD